MRGQRVLGRREWRPPSRSAALRPWIIPDGDGPHIDDAFKAALSTTAFLHRYFEETTCFMLQETIGPLPSTSGLGMGMGITTKSGSASFTLVADEVTVFGPGVVEAVRREHEAGPRQTLVPPSFGGGFVEHSDEPWLLGVDATTRISHAEKGTPIESLVVQYLDWEARGA